MRLVDNIACGTRVGGECRCTGSFMSELSALFVGPLITLLRLILQALVQTYSVHAHAHSTTTTTTTIGTPIGDEEDGIPGSSGIMYIPVHTYVCTLYSSMYSYVYK